LTLAHVVDHPITTLCLGSADQLVNVAEHIYEELKEALCLRGVVALELLWACDGVHVALLCVTFSW
jgi:hypothetical protein